MSLDQALFPAELVPEEINLPDGYHFRALQRNDFVTGHLDPLRDLAYIGEISAEAWIGRFDYMVSCPETYYVLVIVHNDKIVGTGTLFVEKKFLFKLGVQGHIEDIAISNAHQGKKLGLSMIQGLDKIAEKVGCYKNILDCSPENEGFYLKCGYEKAGTEMHHYFSQEAIDHEV